KSAQGTALMPSGTDVIVADYSRGVGRIDLKTTATTWLTRQDGKPLRGIDGLIRCGSVYFGIYNGSAPGALVAIAPTPTGLTFELPLARGALPDPTQVAYDGRRLLIVADSGWATIDKPGFVRTRGASIVAVSLSKDCKPQKVSEYECGFPAFEDARAEFDVRFYLVAILFIVFDLEAAFLFPWAVSLDFTRWSGWIAMMIFLVELGLGLAYAWKKGALEWE